MERKIFSLGDYVILRDQQLGGGHFGTVFKGYHQSKPEKLLAVKQIQYSNAKCDPTKINREIAIMRQIKSKFIVKFYDFKKTSSNVYIFIELCNQGSLSSHLQKCGGKLTVNQCVQFYQQLQEGFKVLYNNNIMHRDIKPDNILLHNGQCKISDFGLGKMLSDLEYEDTKTHTLCGSPNYMAPQLLEQYVKIIRNGGQQKQSTFHYNSKCDIWSMGMVFYQMLVGRRPFQKHDNQQYSVEEWLENIKNIPLEFPENTPPLIKDLISHMLIIDEIERFEWKDIFDHKLFQKEELQKLQGQDIILNLPMPESEEFLIHNSDYQKYFSSQKKEMSMEEDQIQSMPNPLLLQIQSSIYHYQMLVLFNTAFNQQKLQISQVEFMQFMIISLRFCLINSNRLNIEIQQAIQQLQNNGKLMQMLQRAQKQLANNFQIQSQYYEQLAKQYDQQLSPQDKQTEFYKCYFNLNFNFELQLFQLIQNKYHNSIDTYIRQLKNIFQQMKNNNMQIDPVLLQQFFLMLMCIKVDQFLLNEYSGAIINNLDNDLFLMYQHKLANYKMEELLQQIFN